MLRGTTSIRPVGRALQPAITGLRDNGRTRAVLLVTDVLRQFIRATFGAGVAVEAFSLWPPSLSAFHAPTPPGAKR